MTDDELKQIEARYTAANRAAREAAELIRAGRWPGAEPLMRDVAASTRDVETLLAEVRRLRAALAQAEWGAAAPDTGDAICPACGGARDARAGWGPAGHRDDCALAQALGEVGP